MSDSRVGTIPNSFSVYAGASRRFFGLTELVSFTRLSVDPYAKAKSKVTLILDLSAVRVWDIAALLWLIVALDHYRRNAGMEILLRLPESDSTMSKKDRDAFDKSADFLRRWRFDKALQNIDADVANVLVPEQESYFDPPEPRRFYLASKEPDESGLLQSLMSRRLTEIRCLSDPSVPGAKPISSERISGCIREFQAQRIGDILNVQCGIEKRSADLFADHLLTEALLNVQEHPNATIGLTGISILGSSKELILSVIDNGETIPETIYERYMKDTTDGNQPLNPTYNRDALTHVDRGKITHHATKRGVTRKKGPETSQAGMGLTYIKEDTVDNFQGKLTIVSDGVKVTYEGSLKEEPRIDDWRPSWSGNLIRIAIPVAV